ncbi:hypothetical protein L7F22_061521 [Adiantum nelumboides]|nr:hypothetical protein [Adiantum nelumboides]
MDLRLQVGREVVIYCDNLSSIQLAKNPVFHALTKHIEIHYHFLQVQVLAGAIDLVYVNKEERVADIFTKALGAEKLHCFWTVLGVLQLALSSRGNVEMSSSAGTLAAHGQGKSIEASSERPPRQPSGQSPLARPPAQTLIRPPPSKAPPIEPTKKNKKMRVCRQSNSSEGDEDVEKDPKEEDVLDKDFLLLENLDREDEPLGALSDPLPGINIASHLWDHVANHTGGVEPDPQHLFVLVDLRQLRKQIDDAYCRHVPDCYVRPAKELAANAANVKRGAVPVIDLSRIGEDGRRASIIAEVAQACREWGFFQLVNHPVSPALLCRMHSVAEEFFALSVEDKMKFASHEMKFVPDGKAVRFGTSFNPYNDKFLEWRDVLRHWCLPPNEVDNREWPEKPAGYKETVLEYNKEMRVLAQEVLTLIAESLGLHPCFFEEAFQGSRQLLHVNRYPPCPEPELALGTGSHSDPGGLTLLLQDDVVGLQVMHEGEWIAVQPLPDAILINLGDQMQIFTNVRYKSVEHRALVNATKTRMTVLSCSSPAENVIVAPAAKLIELDNVAFYQPSLYGDYSFNFFSKGFQGKAYVVAVPAA